MNQDRKRNQEEMTGTDITCPFLDRNCIKEKCHLYIKVQEQQVVLGVVKPVLSGMCVFLALVKALSALIMLLSTQRSSQPINLPGLKR